MNLQGTPGASPAIDRNKGLHNVLDKAGDKYKIVVEQTANFHRDDGLKITESLLAGMSAPPQVIIAANDDMALGAIEAVKARNLKGITIIGFDALPEALAKVRDGELAATIEQFPAKQSATAVDIMAEYLKSGKKPEQQITLLTPAGDHQGQSQSCRAPQRSEVIRAEREWRARCGAPPQSPFRSASAPEWPTRPRRFRPLRQSQTVRSSR